MAAVLESHIVPTLSQSQRLSDYLIGIFATLPSRKQVKKAIRRGDVRVDGIIADTAHWVQTGSAIELLESTHLLPKIWEQSLPVVYEDDYLALVNKPSGLVVSGNQFRTVQNALLYNLKKSPCTDALRLPRPVHRLDAPTSGLLLIAKTASAIQHLGQQFEHKTIKKQYTAIVSGHTPPTGEISMPISMRPALSRFERIEQVQSLKNDWISLLHLYPETGRTHQLRIHCANSGFPIMGDALYGTKGKILWKKGLFLAATALEWIHPHDGTSRRVSIVAPSKFERLMEREERRFRQKRIDKL